MVPVFFFLLLYAKKESWDCMVLCGDLCEEGKERDDNGVECVTFD